MKFSRCLIVCILAATLILFTSCSSQNPVVNPSPGTWRIVHSMNPGLAQNGLNAVTATSANDAWAVGDYSNSHFDVPARKAFIEHWNGSAWSVVKSPTTPLDGSTLNGVAAISPIDAWAVGYAFSNSNNNEQQSLIEHWDGTTWTFVKSPNLASGTQLFAITALSATDIWVSGVYGNNLGKQNNEHSLVEHWNGTTWTVVQSPNPGSQLNSLNGLTAISANDIWAVGVTDNTQTEVALIEHWNGTSWQTVQNPNPGTAGSFLNTIAAVSANDIWAAGISSSGSTANTLIEHWNGRSWSIVKSPNPGAATNFLTAVVTVSTHNIWIVGFSSNSFNSQEERPLIEHWDGTSWSTVTSPNIGTPTTSLNGASLVPHSTNIWAVGSGATYGVSVSVPSPSATGTSNETPVTAQTLIETCCT
ncbi:MAG TPA: hypothetical protein VKU38_06655 [Ktedonobacteraceae bacterium]|nr:hypothetical protein [Ktedonobacteraceae bacterium]